ncbi:MAG: branched-chain amino acid ABC transporter permease [Halorientalis sp.]
MSGADLGSQIDVDRTDIADWLNPLHKPLRHKLGLLCLVLLAVLPLALTRSEAQTFATAFFFAMFAMSWDSVSGYTGQISFGHSVFFAVGGYTSALLNLHMGLSPLLAIPVGVILAAIFGLVIGVPALRLRGPYLSLVTLIAPLILLQLFVVFGDTLGGNTGLDNPQSLFGLGFTDVLPLYYLAFGLFLFVMFVLLAVTRSDAGRVFTAIRESEDAVNSAGLNPAKFKTFAFVLSAALGGLAGAVYVHTPLVTPTPSALLALFINIEIIIAVIIGGMGTIVGAAAGGIFFVVARYYLNQLHFTVPLLGTPISDVNLLLFAVISLVLVYALPGGLLRGGIVLGRRLLDRQTGDSEDVATDGGQTEFANPLAQIYDNYRGFFGGDDDER